MCYGAWQGGAGGAVYEMTRFRACVCGASLAGMT